MIAEANTTKKLWEEVDSRIKEGWIPQGGVSVSNSPRVTYVQAMILKLK